VFTGLVEEVGVVRRIEKAHHSAHIRIAAERILSDIHVGDSIAVNGACLTVVSYSTGEFVADAVPETLRRTTLGMLQPGDRVNLERALSLHSRLGGHIVSGHVDGLGRIREQGSEGIASVYTIETSPELMRYIVSKGSICVDGVSLTVMDTRENTFRVSIIPHTGQHTSLSAARIGQAVNLECDIIAKYVEQMVARMADGISSKQPDSAVTLEFLRSHGFA
jgi:riboflavin synthase